jgi:SAM-dependent methyltransferase
VTPETVASLRSPQGRAALAAAAALAPTESSRLAALDGLRRHFPPGLAAAALEQALLRRRAVAKFADADALFFTREALEQSTGDIVAAYRAERFRPFARVLDLGCGIGGDAMALAATGRTVIAVDRDPVRLGLCEMNLTALGHTATHINADILTGPLPDADAAFCDPARRVGGKRVLSPNDSDPPPRAVMAKFPHGFPLGFKLAPGVIVDEAVALGGEVEFISLDGELKECCVWTGALKSTGRRATVIRVVHSLREREGLRPGEDTRATCHGSNDVNSDTRSPTRSRSERTTLAAEDPAPWPVVTDVGEFVYDVDATVVRSGLVGDLAKLTGLTAIDYRVAFLTGPLVASPFAVGFRVDDVCPLDAKAVGKVLQSCDVGRVTVVKRGVEADAEKLTAKWKSDRPGHRTVILTRVAGRAKAIVAERITP